MRIELELKPGDPSFAALRQAWRRAGERHAGRHAALAERARFQHAELQPQTLSPAVIEPLARVPVLATLLDQRHFEIEPQARSEFAGALAYFVEPDDLIPDAQDRFGYLDDAMVLRLALAESRHEWFAWCDYLDHVAAYPEDAGIDRATWMQRRRARLDRELRRRHDTGRQGDAGYAQPGRYAPRFTSPGRFGVS